MGNSHAIGAAVVFAKAMEMQCSARIGTAHTWCKSRISATAAKNWGYGLVICSSRTGYVSLGFLKVALIRESLKVDIYIQYSIQIRSMCIYIYIYVQYIYIWTVYKYTHSLNPTCHYVRKCVSLSKKNTSSNPKQTFEVWHNSPKRASRLMKDRQISRDSLLTVLTSFTSPPSTEVHRVNKSWKALRSPHDFSV